MFFTFDVSKLFPSFKFIKDEQFSNIDSILITFKALKLEISRVSNK